MSSKSDVQTFLARARGPLGEAARVVALDELRLRRGGRADDDSIAAPRLALDQLGGRLVELSAQGAVATLTCTVGLVLEAQQQAEPVAWIAIAGTSFYPPDLADSGVDLDALVVVRARELLAGVRAAERLLRSGAFGLIVMDLGRDAELPIAHQGRLIGLAQQHDAAVVCLTAKPAAAASLGSLVSLRVEALRARDRDGSYVATARAIKDKQRGPGWAVTARFRGPAGLR
jgi:recombination protein RecA